MSLVPMSLSLSDLETALGGQLSAQLYGNDVSLVSVSTDTRKLAQGDLFVALQGPNHDAHEHIELARQGGAAALVVARRMDIDLPQLVVDDTRKALGMIAQEWCERCSAIRIAVTGSNGKTTVKEILSAILRAQGSEVHCTPGNLNNEIGLPLTCLGIQAQHEYAVLEMGTNSPGEIAYLSQIAEPSVAVVTQVAAAHLEGFGTVENIAVEKASIFSGVANGGYALIPSDDNYTETLREAAEGLNVRTFGFSSTADIRGTLSPEPFRITFSETLDCALAGRTLEPRFNLLGNHNRHNALAAISAASCVDVEGAAIEQALAQLQAVSGRLQTLETRHEARIIDDSYNANPSSAMAAVDVLANFDGIKILVLGDMLELGPDELEQHGDVGRYAKAQGVDGLMTIGFRAAMAASEFGANAASFSDGRELALALRGSLGANHTLLFKGSRGARLERVIADMLDDSVTTVHAPSAGEGPSLRSQRVISL